MKCKNCGYVNPPDATHCKICHTMLKRAETATASGSSKALLQIVLFIAITAGVIGLLWLLMHTFLHLV